MNIFTALASLQLNLTLSRREANATYIRLIPALKYIIQNKGVNSIEARGLFEILEKLPGIGATRLNFKKHYITKVDGWKDLPDNPDDIPYGFW